MNLTSSELGLPQEWSVSRELVVESGGGGGGVFGCWIVSEDEVEEMHKWRLQ